jgi:hypothetical protein
MKMNKLVVIAALALAGCGVEGTYALDKAETKKASEADIAKLPAAEQEFAKLGIAMMDNMDATLELKSGGAASMKVTMSGKSQETTGTWKKEGDDVTVTAEGKDTKCTKSGKKLTCTEKHASGNTTMVFSKS